MTRVEFYILDSDTTEQRLACVQRLVLQTLGRGKSIHIHTGCASETGQLVRQFQHLREADNITIDHKGEPAPDINVLINMSAEVPFFFSQFETTIEVLHDETQTREMGRERYRYYQERGYPLFHNKVAQEAQLELV
jgi:DNA polymerase-3 subunit chi